MNIIILSYSCLLSMIFKLLISLLILYYIVNLICICILEYINNQYQYIYIDPHFYFVLFFVYFNNVYGIISEYFNFTPLTYITHQSIKW